MLRKDELKVLKTLFDDLTRDLTIMDLAELLNQKYFQTHTTVKNLVKSGDVKIKKIGKSSIVKLDFSKYDYNYVVAEIERANDLCNKNKTINIIREDLKNIDKNFVCVLFGSQVEKPRPDSDVDLLFLIPKDYKYGDFEKLTRTVLLSSGKTDINISFDESLHEMLSHPEKFNVGNELLKKHIVLYGSEHFLNLLRKHYVG
ncbi:MAG: hypothetical protein AABX39_04015 [Nanoarchaeota archaeon]